MALINELNCKTMDRQERLRRRREYERAQHSAETADQKELRLSRRREAHRARCVAHDITASAVGASLAHTRPTMLYIPLVML